MKPRREPWSDVRRVLAGRYGLAYLLFVASLLTTLAVAGGTLALIIANAAEYGFFFVPIASWLVLGLAGLIVALEGIGAYFWIGWRRPGKRLAETAQELGAMQGL
ncbi:MAG: hypothetical protein EHM56_10820, partial [Chloroflexi bacterium]